MPSASALRTRRPTLRSIGLFLTGWITAILLCAGWYWIDARQLERNLKERDLTRVRVYSGFITKSLLAVTGDLRLLAGSEPMRDYLQRRDAIDLRRLESWAAEFGRQRPAYDQLRYLDETGRERMRVNHGGLIVPENGLQNKSDRDYFTNAMALERGRIAMSALNLNMERGEVEQPLKPMLRFSMPVFDESGRRRGIWAINYRVETMFDGFGAIGGHYLRRLRMLNADGYWLKAADPELEWGFQIPGRAEYRLPLSDPSLWGLISGAEDHGQRLHRGGIFTWLRIDPSSLAGGGTRWVDAEDPFWVIASEITPDEMSAEFALLDRTFRLLAGILAVALVLNGWLLWTRIRSRKELETNREMLALMFENAPDANLLVDSAGRILRLNGCTEKVFGWDRSELVGQEMTLLLPQRFRDRHAGHLKAFFAQPRARAMGAGLELYGLRKNGSEFPLDIMLSPLDTPSGVQVLAVIRDITERKASERSIHELNSSLTRQNARLETANAELEAFSYSVSHDLRAPLRHIGGFADMLARNAKDRLDDTGMRYLTVITEATVRMGRLIDDLLQFSRFGRTELSIRDVPLKDLVDEVRHGMEQSGSKPAVTWNVAPLPVVRGDPALLRQVVANLLDNAVKYSGRKEHPVIEVFPAQDEHGDVGMSVRDNGAGFDMRYVDKLFGVFQRLHGSGEFEGNGVGLANVRRILSRHGGRIWAEGRVNEGATFTFVLPAAPPPTSS